MSIKYSLQVALGAFCLSLSPAALAMAFSFDALDNDPLPLSPPAFYQDIESTEPDDS